MFLLSSHHIYMFSYPIPYKKFYQGRPVNFGMDHVNFEENTYTVNLFMHSALYYSLPNLFNYSALYCGLAILFIFFALPSAVVQDRRHGAATIHRRRSSSNTVTWPFVLHVHRAFAAIHKNNIAAPNLWHPIDTYDRVALAHRG